MILYRFLLVQITIILVLVSSDVFALTQQQRKTVLNLHNSIREQYNLPSLTWDMNIEKQAQDWANALAKNNVFKHSSFSTNKWMWENLYMITTYEKRIRSDGSEAVMLWLQEWQDYDYASNSCNSGAICGHFTQLIWKDTKRIGCGHATRRRWNMAMIYWVCQYDPPGNYEWERPY